MIKKILIILAQLILLASAIIFSIGNNNTDIVFKYWIAVLAIVGFMSVHHFLDK